MSALESTALPSLLVPEKLQRVTPALDPKYLRNWFSSLPITNTASAAQELYRVLCNLNRLPMDARVRLELFELSTSPVASVISGLQAHLGTVTLPLPPKKRQLADFLRQFQTQMAYGYKSVIQDMHAPGVWQKNRETMALAVERAIRHLALSLLRSYQVYIPYPAGIWREIHGLYRYAETNAGHVDLVPIASDGGSAQTSVLKSYLQTVLLGLCGPYQLPPNECSHVHAFLVNWADKAVIAQSLDVADTVGHFLIDLSADLPPTLFPRDVKPRTAPHLRDLVTLELARSVHALIGRLQKGESPRALNLGADCIDSACIDMLQRMLKFWGISARRQFSRRAKKDSQLAVCAGLKALHFFSDGQRSFAPPEQAGPALDPTPEINMQGSQTRNFAIDGMESDAVDENFRIERWRIRDESAAGLSLLHLGEENVAVRVGDLLGLYNEDARSWRVGLARWLKNPEMAKLEMGVEMLAPSARPVAVRPHTTDHKGKTEYSQALLLPAVEALRQPPSLIVSRGAHQSGQDLWLADGQAEPRRVHPLSVIERSASFEQIAFAEATVN